MLLQTQPYACVGGAWSSCALCLGEVWDSERCSRSASSPSGTSSAPVCPLSSSILFSSSASESSRISIVFMWILVSLINGLRNLCASRIFVLIGSLWAASVNASRAISLDTPPIRTSRVRFYHTTRIPDYLCRCPYVFPRAFWLPVCPGKYGSRLSLVVSSCGWRGCLLFMNYLATNQRATRWLTPTKATDPAQSLVQKRRSAMFTFS